MKINIISFSVAASFFFISYGSYAATYYEVWRNTTNNSSSATRMAGWLTSTNYDDTTTIQGQTYYYWVKVVTANTAYGFQKIVGDYIELHVWATIPTASHRNYHSPIQLMVRLVPFGFSWTGNLTNRLMEKDALFNDTMDEWYYNNIYIGGSTPWERTWTRDIKIGDYETSGTAEVYGYAKWLYSNGSKLVDASTSTSNVTLRTSFDSAPTGVNASNNDPTKIRITWNPASGNSHFSSSCQGIRPMEYALVVQSAGVSGVSITSSTGHGGVTTYMKTLTSGTSVNLQAPYYVGSCAARTRFTGWTGSVTSSNQSITFTMDGNKTVTANYVSDPETYTLSVNSSGASSVSISSSTGHSGTTNYTKTVTCGTSVSLTAPATSGGMTFTGWTGSVSSSNQTISFSMNGNKTVTANYEVPPYTLTVNSSGASGVSIGSSTGHSGTTNYSKTVTNGTSVNLQAPYYVGSCASRTRFNGWTGSVTSSSQSITFTMDGNKTVTANYISDPETYTLSVNSSGVSNVSISSSSGHSGTTNYTKTVTCGTTVTLTAPLMASGKTFAGWTGDVSSSNQTISFSMSGNKTVTANYAIATYTLTTSVIGGNGTLSPPSGDYGEGTVVTLTADPDFGYRVKAWSGTDNDSSKASTNTVTMNSNKFVTVEFEVGQESATGWNLMNYDLHNSNLYPYPSEMRVQNVPFTVQWTGVGTTMMTGDIDGDGALELVTSDGSNLYVYNGNGQLKWQMAIAASLNVLADVTGDGTSEILMSIKDGATGRIEAYSGSAPNLLVKTFTTSVDTSYGGVTARGVSDLDQNGFMELIAFKGAGWVQGRGVVVFDCDTTNELWYYDVGPFVQYLAVGDVSGLLTDKEILHGSGGPSNGVTGADGSRDYACYAFLLDTSGNSLWRKQFEGSGFVDASAGLCDIDNDGRLDVIATSYSHGWNFWDGSLGRVYILDPTIGEPISGYERNFSTAVTLGGFADLDKDGTAEILVNKKNGATQTGSVVALSSVSGLPVTMEFSVPGSALDVLFINDLNGDGKLEVIVKGTPANGSDHTLYVLDNELNLLWSIMPGGSLQAIVSDLNEDGMNELILAASGVISVLQGHECANISCDFDGDCDVDTCDLLVFTLRWLETGCMAPDFCEGTDIDADSNVNLIDFSIFAGDWQKGIVQIPPEPELFYRQPLDSDPGWNTEGLWAFGQPTGGGGAYGGPDPTSGYTGSNVYGYNLEGDYENNLSQKHLTSSAIDCTGQFNIHLKFWRWLGVESPTYDHAYVQVSNNGIDWSIVWQNTGHITDTGWVQIDIDISSIADNNSSVYLRWTMGPTDSSWTFCGWNIDDIELWGNAN